MRPRKTSDGATILEKSETPNGRVIVASYIDKEAEAKLPQTSQFLKSGSLLEYVKHMCGTENDELSSTGESELNQERSFRCEVYARLGNGSALLDGFLMVLSDGKKSVVFDDNTPARQGCYLNATLEIAPSGAGDYGLLTDIRKNFEATYEFAVKRSDANQFVRQSSKVFLDTESDNLEEAHGQYYIKRSANKLEITQERWNYCISQQQRDTGDGPIMDEVFQLVASYEVGEYKPAPFQPGEAHKAAANNVPAKPQEESIQESVQLASDAVFEVAAAQPSAACRTVTYRATPPNCSHHGTCLQTVERQRIVCGNEAPPRSANPMRDFRLGLAMGAEIQRRARERSAAAAAPEPVEDQEIAEELSEAEPE